MHKAHLIWMAVLAALAVDVTLAALKKFGVSLPGLAA